MVKICK